MRNPYDVLGIKPTAGEHEVRKAFRRLAKQWHPDMKPGDAAAEGKFREINAAYDLLSDPAKRARFDRGEIDAEGHERYEHAEADFRRGPDQRPSGGGFGGGFSWESHDGMGDAEDLLSHLFGGRFHSAGRGEDRRASITVSFLDAAKGASRRIALTGERSLDVAIPAGVTDGQILRLKGQGEPRGRNGTTPGDLLLTVRVASHPLFRREGNDVHADIPITLGEAVLGGRVMVPTIEGAVAVKVPAGSNTGAILRLKGRGIKGGDQYIRLMVKLPEKIDDDLTRFITRWSSRHPYEARGFTA